MPRGKKGELTLHTFSDTTGRTNLTHFFGQYPAFFVGYEVEYFVFNMFNVLFKTKEECQNKYLTLFSLVYIPL
ncbi:hypothetical protein HQ35_05095 [Porphyromonas cangingivalis]|uniref:Uncharacterized protein n=1 Tax=Porphyromonas cangingivalis TaxID=36874 RepID=A0A0A2EPF7_PORCN|nr:hypothetical protein HQ35_05095 [Porphyromonas cangingivalis]